MNAAAIAGSDDANGDSGHDSDEGWKGQGTAAEAGGGSRTGLRARLHWELQSPLGGGEYKVAFWLSPSPAYIEPAWAAEGSFMRLFAGLAKLACWHSCIS